MTLGLNSGAATQLDVEVQNAQRVPVDTEIKRRSEAMHRYLVGQLSYADEDFKTAMENFKEASALISEPEPELHAKLAELYIRSGELELALKESERALEPDPLNPQKLLLHAGILEALKRTEEAQKVYRQVIAAKPELTDAYVLLAALYVKSDQVDQALNVLQSLVKQAPADPLGLYYLSRALEIKGDLKKAESTLQQAYEKNRANNEIAMDLVRLKLKNQKVDQARQICEEILERDPQNVLARRVVGQLLIGANQLDKALEHLKALETLEKDPAETRFKVALIQIQRQEYKEAVAELNLVLAQNPNHGQARYYLATVYAASGRLKEALEELLKVKPDNEMFAKSRMFAAFVARQNNDLSSAEKAVREALQSDPENKSMLSYLVLVLREKGDFSKAEKLLKSSVEAEPANDRLRFQYAIVLHDLLRKSEAMNQMERVIKDNPKNSDALNYIAYGIIEQGGDLQRAETIVKQALEIKPDDAFYQDTLGWLLYKRGDYAQAQKLLSQAFSASEEDIVIAEHYADCLVKLGEAQRALEVYEVALKRSKKATSKDDKDAILRIQVKIKQLRLQFNSQLAPVQNSAKK